VPKEDKMIRRLTKRHEKVNLWKSKLSKCSFVMAAISAVGFGVALLPFVTGPPPHLSDLKFDMRPVHHYRSDNNHKDHMQY